MVDYTKIANNGTELPADAVLGCTGIGIHNTLLGRYETGKIMCLITSSQQYRFLPLANPSASAR